MIEGNRLWMYVIYDHPKDFPEEFVCRRHCLENGRATIEPELFARGRTIEYVRAQIPNGEYRIGRSLEDDPVIVETWL